MTRATDIYTADIPRIYAEFAGVIGDERWRRRVVKCTLAIKGNSFLREYLRRENLIAFELEKLRKSVEVTP